MGWKKVSVEDERLQFTRRHLEGEQVTDLRGTGARGFVGQKFRPGQK